MQNLYAFNATYRTLTWRASMGSGVVQAPPTLSGKVIYAGASDGNLYAFSLSSGAPLWNYTTGGAILASPQVFNGVIYTGSEDNTISLIASEENSQCVTIHSK